MRAVVIDRFGDVDALELRDIPLPELGPDEVLLQVEVAGVGEWDPFERAGGYAQMLGLEAKFPYVLGSEGAGALAAVGSRVSQFKPGDRVYAVGFLNPKGGFYAEYAVVNARMVSPIPGRLTIEQAAVIGGAGLTALRGLDEVLKLKPAESIAIFGAGGGVGHLAMQLAKGMGARVLAVPSGEDGVALTTKLGADATVDGRADDFISHVRAFAPKGLDAVLLTAGGEAAETLLSALRPGGHAAYPNGIEPPPRERSEFQLSGYNGEPDAEIVRKLSARIDAEPSFQVHVARTFALDEVVEAHRALDQHYLGKLALRIA